MKQIFLISYHLDGVTAGPSVRFQRYAPLFMERGYRLCIVTKKIANSYPEWEERENFDIIRIKANYKFWNHTTFIFKALAKCLQQRKKIHAVLTFSITTFSIFLLPFYKIKKLPLYYINTMAIDHIYIKGDNPLVKLYNWIHLQLYSILYKNISGIITSTETLKKYFDAHKLAERHFIKIYNGVDCERFYPTMPEDKVKIRESLGLTLNKKTFIYVGLKTERKGLWDLLDAWRNWEGSAYCQLVLIGDEKPDANNSSFNQFWANFKENHIGANHGIISLGNQKNISEYFKAADCFVFLSKKEGMPNVLLEAMACGLPTILTPFEGFSSDYGVNNEHFLLVERKRGDIINAFQKNYDDLKGIKVIAKNAAEKMKSEYAVQNSIQHYVNLFEGVINHN